MIVKIVGFKLGQKQLTCDFEVPLGREKDYEGDYKGMVESELGWFLRIALEKSDFVSVRK